MGFALLMKFGGKTFLTVMEFSYITEFSFSTSAIKPVFYYMSCSSVKSNSLVSFSSLVSVSVLSVRKDNIKKCSSVSSSFVLHCVQCVFPSVCLVR